MRTWSRIFRIKFLMYLRCIVEYRLTNIFPLLFYVGGFSIHYFSDVSFWFEYSEFARKWYLTKINTHLIKENTILMKKLSKFWQVLINRKIWNIKKNYTIICSLKILCKVRILTKFVLINRLVFCLFISMYSQKQIYRKRYLGITIIFLFQNIF